MDMKKGGVGGHKGEGEDDIKGRERTDMIGEGAPSPLCPSSPSPIISVLQI